MKIKFKKSKRRSTHHLPQLKKSSLFSTISIKKTPKRKQKVLLKKFTFRFFTFLGLFIFSLGFLVVLFITRHQAILSPIPAVFSDILQAYGQKNPDVVTGQVKEQLNKHAISFSTISVQGGDIHIQSVDNTEVVLSANKDISIQIDSLQVTMDNLTIEGKRISRVDMRFERPVVTFK